MRRIDPEAWIGLRAWKVGDDGKRNARTGELNKQMTILLRKNFRGFQTNTDIKRTIGDQQQREALEFSGELDGTQMWGEAMAFENKGLGYVLLIFAPLDKWKDASEDLYKLRNSFSFASLRDNWKPGEAEIIPHYVDDGDYM